MLQRKVWTEFSTTMNNLLSPGGGSMTTSTVTPEIVAFAPGVARRAGRPAAEEVDDLTEGLEADLAEAYAEDLQRELPDPAAYATELRPRPGCRVRTKAKSGVLSGLARAGSDTRATSRSRSAATRRSPAPLTSSSRCVRPGGSSVPGWRPGIVASFFGERARLWLRTALVARVRCVRRRQRPVGPRSLARQGVPALIAIGNVVGDVGVCRAMLTPRASMPANTDGDVDGYADATSDRTARVYLNGQPVTNIYRVRR